MVENQCGSSDINQSKEAKAMLKPKRGIAGALTFLMSEVMPQSPVLSMSIDALYKLMSDIAPYNKIDNLTNDKERGI